MLTGVLVFVARERARLREALVALVARVQALAALAGAVGRREQALDAARADDARGRAEFRLLHDARRDARRRRQVAAVVAARVARLAALVARAGRAERRALQRLLLGAGNVGRLRRQFARQEALTAASDTRLLH